MTARADQPPPPPRQPRPAGRIAMLIAGILIGAVIATAVGVVLLGMGLATVGDAEEVIEAPESTESPEPTDSPDATDGPDAADSPGATDPADTATGAGSTETTGTGTDPAATGGGAVPEPCVISAEYNVAIDVQVDQLTSGARDEDARTIQEALDAIQTARLDADGAAEECLDLAGSSTP